MTSFPITQKERPNQAAGDSRQVLGLILENATGGTHLETPDERGLGARNGHGEIDLFRLPILSSPNVNLYNRLHLTSVRSVADQVQ